MLVLLSALLFEREREITDTLVELLISTVHRINARAEKKVVEEFVKDFRRVTGKDTMLRQIAEASLEAPDGTVREVIYPSSAGRRRCGTWSSSTGPAAPSISATSVGCSSLVHEPLPTGPDQAAGRAGVPLQQHRPPARDLALDLIVRHASSRSLTVKAERPA